MANQKTVLVTDDDEALRKLYETQLTMDGYKVVSAGDGDECLEKSVSEKPDLILLDIMMPKRDGMATLKAIKDNVETKAIPVLMLTNFGQEDMVKNALNIGATDFLLKYRVTPAEMSAKVSEIINHSAVEL